MFAIHRPCRMCGFYRPSLHMYAHVGPVRCVASIGQVRSYAVEIPKRFGPNPPTGGATCDPHPVVIAQWACSGLGARVEKVGPVQWNWIQTLVSLSQFQSPLLLSRSTTRRSASGLRATTMCTARISLLASTSVSGAATGASWAFIASFYSGTQQGQGLSGVGTRNPDGP